VWPAVRQEWERLYHALADGTFDTPPTARPAGARGARDARGPVAAG
jgi:hypothetical protein